MVLHRQQRLRLTDHGPSTAALVLMFSVIAIVLGMASWKLFAGFVGAIAAGESVIASTESGTAQRLTQNYGDALAVEKEGYGFLGAAREVRGVSALVIRGISDLLDGKEAADKQGSQALAARNASTFAFELLAKLEGAATPTEVAEHIDSVTFDPDQT